MISSFISSGSIDGIISKLFCLGRFRVNSSDVGYANAAEIKGKVWLIPGNNAFILYS